MKVSFEGLRSHLLSSYNSLTRKLNNATEKDSDGRDYDKIEINASEIERDMEGIRNIVVTMAYMFKEGEDGFKEMENPHFEDFHPEEEAMELGFDGEVDNSEPAYRRWIDYTDDEWSIDEKECIDPLYVMVKDYQTG